MATTQSGRENSLSQASGTARDSLIPTQGAWWKFGVGLLMLYVIYGTFFVAKGAKGFVDNGEVARIIFFHVPVAALSSLWFLLSGVYAVQYLFFPKKATFETDSKSAICMELGFLQCILATITGSIFAYPEWGSFWNWDPRETSIVLMLLLYAAYLVLRGALREQIEKRARLSAVYAIIALVPGLFLIWVPTRIESLGSNHPTTVLTDAASTSSTYKLVLAVSFLAFILLFVWLFQLRLRLYRLIARKQMRIQ